MFRALETVYLKFCIPIAAAAAAAAAVGCVCLLFSLQSVSKLEKEIFGHSTHTKNPW